MRTLQGIAQLKRQLLEVRERELVVMGASERGSERERERERELGDGGFKRAGDGRRGWR